MTPRDTSPPSTPGAPGAAFPPALGATVVRHGWMDRFAFAALQRFPASMSVLTLDNAVFFPGALMPLALTRPVSLETARLAEANGMPVVILWEGSFQRTAPVGCASRVLKSETAEDGSVEVVVQGLARVSVRLRGTPQSTVAADTTPLPDLATTGGGETAFREMKAMALEVIHLLAEMPPDAVDLLDGIRDAGHLADIVAANIDSTLAEKAGVLECRDVGLRQRMVMELLRRQRDLLKARR